MPEYEPPLSRPPGCGGTLLRPDTGAILKACESLGPLFVLFRNEACILGSVVDPLRFHDLERWHVAIGGAMSLNLGARASGSAFAYVEPGPHGGFIDAIEFCGPAEAGFLKVCRMDSTNQEGWLKVLRDFHLEDASPLRISGIRKTNHLGPRPFSETAHSPAEVVLKRFIHCATEHGALLQVTAQGAGARGRLEFRPTHSVRLGCWDVLSSGNEAMHLATGGVAELRVVTRPGHLLLVLLRKGGRLLVRILTRDRAVMSQLSEIL